MMEKEIVIDMRDLIDDIQKKLNNGQQVLLKGEGLSMSPFITAADTLMLQKPKSQTVRPGEIYLYKRFDGSYAIHRVYAVKGEFAFMLGDAQLFIEKVSKRCLVAIVCRVQRPEKTVECTGLSVRLSSIVRMRTRILSTKCRFAALRCMDSVLVFLGKLKKLLTKE